MKRTISTTLILTLVVLCAFADSSAPDGSRGVSTYVEGLDSSLVVGTQYLVVIAINNYQHWLPLHSPVKDAQEIRDILLSRYYIDTVLELYDEEATKANIIKLLVRLQEEVETHDSVLIFFSGHGHLDENSNTGFWIPVNAGTGIYEQPNWLPHTQLKGLIANIKATHVCVISDSCFAGDLIYTTRSMPTTIDAEYFKRSYSRVSRQVLTSGATEIVPDESEFAHQLKLILQRNQDRFLDALMLYNEVRLGVESSIPLLGALGGTGHQEGASFVLFLREEAQAEPTPFGPIHLQPGPSQSVLGESATQYLSTALLAGPLLPVMGVGPVDSGMDIQLHFHLNRYQRWGTAGLGLVSGLSMWSESDIDFECNLRCVPLAANMRYISVPRSRFFWSADLSFGAMFSFITIIEPAEDRLVVTKPFVSPTLSIGRRFYENWCVSLYCGYLLIVYDNNPYTGIPTGIRVEYTF